ncbi:MAG: hypothetical protein ACE5EH_01295 [Gammaproteobacteria bacterium]
MKFALIFFVLLMAIGINLPDGMIARFGVDPDFLLMSLIALCFTGLVVHRRLALIISVILLCAGANLPADYAVDVGIERDYLTASLMALIFSPYLMRWVE